MSRIKSAYITLILILTVTYEVDKTYGLTTFKSAMGERGETAQIQTTTLPPVTTSESVLGESGETPVRRAGVERSEADVQAGLALLRQQANCGKSDADRVGNGVYANLSEFPWMALLIYSDGVERMIKCAGTLIHERYVLTAAHCIQTRGKRLVSVRLGDHDAETEEDCEGEGDKRKCAPPTQEIDIEEAIYHKDYTHIEYSNDIGLLRLVNNAVIRTNVRPICLPITQKSRDYSLSHMMTAGWRLKDNRSKAKILQKATVPIRTIDYCQEIYRASRITHKQICVGGGEYPINICQGDSGGPLFYIAPYNWDVRYIQYGVAMGSSNVCGSNEPGIYVRVEKYLRWIASNLT
ncbi:serine protease grass-like [Episyrphus balteatus]|uniref:serine protease grass-like n=1 Tax=Episyrphus balteatus TaxID=286459 RepID=UPI0024863F8C|nr:serine protease grass-like [Episyrphus balteatus]